MFKRRSIANSIMTIIAIVLLLLLPTLTFGRSLVTQFDQVTGQTTEKR